ncbi:MAG: hypothetical protein IT565_11645 [Rhodospirillales bacterium]|nr:hypothetical protein [Rhodospirillales bacterium]
MSLVWAILGTAGALIAFAFQPWPAPIQRLRNGAAATLALAAGLIAYVAAAHPAWLGGVAWYAAFLLLQLSHRGLRPGRWIAARLIVVGILVPLAAWAIARLG